MSIARGRPSHRLRGSYWTLLLCVVIGSVMGALICLTNIHFGLQTGYINIMQMQSALVGFTAMKTLVRHTTFPFGKGDNILIQTISSAIGRRRRPPASSVSFPPSSTS